MLPNLIIIGAQKCGTSALHQYLGSHPDVFMSEEKELNFFLERKNWNKGRAWYESMFPTAAKVRGEASPDYTNHPAYPDVPEKMHALLPDAKLIYMVRHPIDRMVSHYMHQRWLGSETRPMSEAFRGEHGVPMGETRYARRSKYFMQLDQYLRYFKRSSILILTQEDLFTRRNDVLRETFVFLGVDATFQSDEFSKAINESSRKKAKNRLGLALARGPKRGLLRKLPRFASQPAQAVARLMTTSTIERPTLDETLRRELLDVLGEDIEQFRRLTGKALPEWSL